MSRFCPLYSSSGGNSTFVSGGGFGLLVDAGVSSRALFNALNKIHVDPFTDIHAILLTHEHIDHIKGLKVLLKRLKVPVYGSRMTLEYILHHDMAPADAAFIPIDKKTDVFDISVTPFDTPHDSSHSVGYRLEMPDGRKMAIATDLGHVNNVVRQHLTGCDLVMLESNYDEGMLDCSRYPYYLKRRISSNTGHLPNSLCAAEILNLAINGTTRFFLAHLSKENNLPALALQTVKAALDSAGLLENYDYTLSVAPRGGPEEVVVF